MDFPKVGEIMDFSMEWEKKISRGLTVVKFDFINSKLRQRQFLTKNLLNKYQITTSTGLSSSPLLKLMHISILQNKIDIVNF